MPSHTHTPHTYAPHHYTYTARLDVSPALPHAHTHTGGFADDAFVTRTFPSVIVTIFPVDRVRFCVVPTTLLPTHPLYLLRFRTTLPAHTYHLNLLPPFAGWVSQPARLPLPDAPFYLPYGCAAWFVTVGLARRFAYTLPPHTYFRYLYSWVYLKALSRARCWPGTVCSLPHAA